MKYAKVFGILLMAGMLFVSCGEPVELGEPVHLFGRIAENEFVSLLSYQVCDGKRTVSYWIPLEEREEANRQILDDLHAVEAYPVVGEPPEAEFPLYSVFAQDDEHAVPENAAFTWSDGYLYDSDGTVYAFDFDFPSMAEDYGMRYIEEGDGVVEDNVWNGVSAEAMYWIAQDSEGWNKKWLTLAEERMISAEIVLTGAGLSDGILSFSLTNSGDRTMRTRGTDYSLHVKLDGIWYKVPSLPGTVIWDYIPEIPAGETYEQACPLRDHYGDLPAGTYRVETVVWAEGDGARKTAVYHEFTIE